MPFLTKRTADTCARRKSCTTEGRFRGREICRQAVIASHDRVGPQVRRDPPVAKTLGTGQATSLAEQPGVVFEDVHTDARTSRRDWLTQVKPVAHSEDAQAVKVHLSVGAGARKSALPLKPSATQEGDYVTKRFLPLESAETRPTYSLVNLQDGQ